MKVCKRPDCDRLGQQLPDSEFYVRRSCSDGLDYWCKTCRNKNNQKYRRKERKTAWSTLRAMELLKAKKIPCVAGYNAGIPYCDIVAFGYIKIEAKSSLVFGRKRERCHWAFRRHQVENGSNDFFLLIAKGVKERYFVVPAWDPVMSFPGERLIVRLDELQKYERATHLIFAEVVDYAKTVSTETRSSQ